MTEKHEARKDQIFSVGAKLFAQKGYERTSLQEVADLLGLTKPALYYYYESKEKLLFEIMAFVMDRVLDEVRGVEESPLAPLEKLGELIRRHIGFFAAHPDEQTIMATQVDALSPAPREIIIERQREYVQRVRGIVAEFLREDGDEDLDPTAVAFALLGGMNWLFKWYDPEGRITPDKLASDFLAIYSRGLRHHPTTSEERK